MLDQKFQPSRREQERIGRARAVLARETGVPDSELEINWTFNSASSLLISLAASPGRSYVVKLSKGLVNYSKHLHSPNWRSWNEFVWMHTAYLEGYRNTLRPLYGSAPDGFLILPELPRDRFHDLRSLLIRDAVDGAVVLEIFRAFLDIRGRLDGSWRSELPFHAPEAVFYKSRIVPHFFAILLKYRDSGLATAIEKVINYLLTDQRMVIHGDFSPKNILVGNGTHYLIDAEEAGFGNADFDPFFFLSQLLIESTGSSDRRLWGEVAAEAAALHFADEPPDPRRAAMCSSMLATMMLARLEGMSRPRVYGELKISPRFVDCVRANVASPADPIDFVREIGGL